MEIDRTIGIDGTHEVEFDIQNGFGYLLCCFATVSYGLGITCCYCAYKQVSSQELNLENNRVHYKSDCCLYRQDKMVPLDRIQDVNIVENCCHRLWGVADIQIQTAGGGEKPEITIIAPKDPKKVRDHIMAARDAFVHTGAASEGISSPLLGNVINGDKGLDTVNQTLLRMEALMEKGLSDRTRSIEA